MAAGLVSPVSAGEGGGEWFQHRFERAWFENSDPTLVTNRILTELSYEDFDGDQATLKLETSIRFGRPIRDGLAFGVQVLEPLKWVDTGTAEEFGVGDFEARAGLVGRISPTLRWACAVNAAFDTASDSALGGNVLELRPITAIRWDASERLNVGLNIEYNFSPREEGADDVSALELKFPVAVKLTDDWSAALACKPRWNFLDETNRHRVELGVTRVWGADRQYTLSFGGEVPLTSESFNWKLISGFVWNF